MDSLLTTLYPGGKQAFLERMAAVWITYQKAE